MLVKLLYDLLEPYAMKVARTVLRGEGISNNPNLPDMGNGGDLVDFGTQYHKCTVRELLDRLSEYRPGNTLSFQQPTFPGLLGRVKRKIPRTARS